MSQPHDHEPVEARRLNLDQGRYPWWVWLITVGGSILMIVGAIIALIDPALLVGGGGQTNETANVYASYFVSRNLVVGIFLSAAIVVRASGPLRTMLLLTAAIQLSDAVLDCFERRWSVVPVALFIGLMSLIAARRVIAIPLLPKREVSSF